MSFKKIYILILFLTFFLNWLHSCTCVSYDSFISIYKNRPDSKIVKIVKLYDYEWGMYVKVIEDYYSAGIGDTILIWGLGDIGCRDIRTNRFQEGDTLMYIPTKTSLEGNFYREGIDTLEKENDFEIALCGSNYAKIINDTVFILKSNAIDFYKIHINNFYNWIDTIKVSVIENNIEDFNVFFSKINKKINIYTNFNNSYFIRIYNLLGDLVISNKKNGDCSLSTTGLAGGLYIIKIFDYFGKSYSKKIWIN